MSGFSPLPSETQTRPNYEPSWDFTLSTQIACLINGVAWHDVMPRSRFMRKRLAQDGHTEGLAQLETCAALFRLPVSGFVALSGRTFNLYKAYLRACHRRYLPPYVKPKKAMELHLGRWREWIERGDDTATKIINEASSQLGLLPREFVALSERLPQFEHALQNNVQRLMGDKSFWWVLTLRSPVEWRLCAYWEALFAIDVMYQPWSADALEAVRRARHWFSGADLIRAIEAYYVLCQGQPAPITELFKTEGVIRAFVHLWQVIRPDTRARYWSFIQAAREQAKVGIGGSDGISGGC